MVNHAEEIMAQMGWTDGFHVPVANEENKKLENEVEKYFLKKLQYSNQLDALNERVEAIRKHTKNMELQQQQNQMLLFAHRRQLEGETTLTSVAQREKANAAEDAKRLERERREAERRRNEKLKEQQMYEARVEALRAELHAGREVLLEWEEELARNETGTLTIDLYMKQDERDIKGMALKRDRLKKELEERKVIVDRCAMQVAVLEGTLQASTRAFRSLHRERKRLVHLWENTVGQLHARDQEIQDTIESMVKLKEHLSERADVLDEQRKFVESEQRNNEELDLEISDTTRFIGQQTDANDRLNKTLSHLLDMLGILQREVRNEGHRLEDLRAKNKGARRQMKDDADRANRVRKLLESLEVHVDKICSDCEGSATRTVDIENMIEGEERYLKSLTSDVEKVNKIKLAVDVKVREVRKLEETRERELQALIISKKKLERLRKEAEQATRRQKETSYNMAFEAMRIEARITRLSGDRVVQNAEELMQRIADQEQEASVRTATHNVLVGQIKHLDDTMRHLRAEMGIDQREMDRLSSRVQTLQMEVDGGIKLLAATERKKREHQVEHSILRLRVRQAELQKEKHGNTLFSLKKQTAQMEALMRERQVEISLVTDMLNLKKRGLQEEKSAFQRETQRRDARTEQIKVKHDLCEATFGRDEDGEPLTLLSAQMQICQEKFMLQNKGDELDEDIRKSEKEIQALENTLKVLNATNDAYNKHLGAVDEDSPEMKEKRKLEAESSEAFNEVRELRALLKTENAKLEEAKQDLAVAVEEKRLTQEALRAKEKEVARVERDVEVQQQKIERATRHIKQLTRELRGRRQTKEVSLEERDIDVREAAERVKAALQLLLEISVLHPESAPLVRRYVEERGLELPPAPRIPSTRIPSTRVPSTRVPSTRVPSTRIPSTRIPSTRIPSTRTATPATSIISGTATPATSIIAGTATPATSIIAGTPSLTSSKGSIAESLHSPFTARSAFSLSSPSIVTLELPASKAAMSNFSGKQAKTAMKRGKNCHLSGRVHHAFISFYGWFHQSVQIVCLIVSSLTACSF